MKKPEIQQFLIKMTKGLLLWYWKRTDNALEMGMKTGSITHYSCGYEFCVSTGYTPPSVRSFWCQVIVVGSMKRMNIDTCQE